MGDTNLDYQRCCPHTSRQTGAEESATVTGGPPPITPVAHDTELLPGDRDSSSVGPVGVREGPGPSAKPPYLQHPHVIKTGPPG